MFLICCQTKYFKFLKIINLFLKFGWLKFKFMYYCSSNLWLHCVRTLGKKDCSLSTGQLLSTVHLEIKAQKILCHNERDLSTRESKNKRNTMDHCQFYKILYTFWKGVSEIWTDAHSIIPMTHAPETGTENRLHFSGTSFWYVYHANLWPDSSDTRNRCRLEHRSISKPETGVRVTEMMIYRWLLFIFVISCKHSVNSRVVIYLFIVLHCLRCLQPHLFLRQKCSFQSINLFTRCIWYEKPVPENGANLWHRFLKCVSRV